MAPSRKPLQKAPTKSSEKFNETKLHGIVTRSRRQLSGRKAVPQNKHAKDAVKMDLNSSAPAKKVGGRGNGGNGSTGRNRSSNGETEFKSLNSGDLQHKGIGSASGKKGGGRIGSRRRNREVESDFLDSGGLPREGHKITPGLFGNTDYRSTPLLYDINAWLRSIKKGGDGNGRKRNKGNGRNGSRGGTAENNFLVSLNDIPRKERAEAIQILRGRDDGLGHATWYGRKGELGGLWSGPLAGRKSRHRGFWSGPLVEKCKYAPEKDRPIDWLFAEPNKDPLCFGENPIYFGGLEFRLIFLSDKNSPVGTQAVEVSKAGGTEANVDVSSNGETSLEFAEN